MIYKDYTAECNRLKGLQKSLNRRFIEEYKYKDLFGKPVMVFYRFRGKMRRERHFFKGLEPFLNDMEPAFYYLRQDGTQSNTRVGTIYSLKQIQNIIAIEDDNGKIDSTNQGNANSSASVRKDKGLAGTAGNENAGNESGQND